jgi:hypothetical protein
MNEDLFKNIRRTATCVASIGDLLDNSIITPKEYRRLFKVIRGRFNQLGVDL